MTVLSELIVNGTELADLFGVSSASITQLVDAGTIARLPGKKYQVRDCTRSYALHLRKGASGRKVGRTAKDASLEEGARYKALQCEIAEIRLATERAHVVPIDQVRATWLRNAAVFRSAVLSLPDRVAAALSLSATDTKEVARVVDALLAEIAVERVTDGT